MEKIRSPLPPPTSQRRLSVKILPIVFLAGISFIACSRQSGDISYAKQIQPILDQKCLTCHGTQPHRGKIILTSFERFSSSRAVSGGGPLVIAGKPQESRLWIVCASSQPHFRMPPDSSAFVPLDAAELGLVYKWIAQGAKNN
jgi:hypothetical protein